MISLRNGLKERVGFQPLGGVPQQPAGLAIKVSRSRAGLACSRNFIYHA